MAAGDWVMHIGMCNSAVHVLFCETAMEHDTLHVHKFKGIHKACIHVYTYVHCSIILPPSTCTCQVHVPTR